VVLVRTDVSEEPSASFIRVTRIGELGTTLAATSNRRTLRNLTNKKSFLRSVGRLLVTTNIVYYTGTIDSSVLVTRLTGPSSTPTTTKKILSRPESNPGRLVCG
jgi:hypothetical protein